MTIAAETDRSVLCVKATPTEVMPKSNEVLNSFEFVFNYLNFVCGFSRPICQTIWYESEAKT